MNASNPPSIKTIAICETCGAPATERVVDLQEFSQEGSWPQHEAYGTHHFCQKHHRPARIYDEWGMMIPACELR